MSYDLYPACIHEGDLSPESFGSEVDEICEEIRAACKGWGYDQKRLLRVMGSMTPEDRCKVPIRYKAMYKKDLDKVIKSEAGSSDLGVGLRLLSMNPLEADVYLIHKACKGLGTDEKLLYSILLGRTNKEMELIKKKYFEVYSQDLAQMLGAELSGNFEKLIITALQATQETFDPDYHTEARMQQETDRLYKMSQGQWGTDETSLFKLLCAAPPQFLAWINTTYVDKHGVTLPKLMEKELSGKTEKAAVFLVLMKLKPFEAVAHLIKSACAGLGTDELLLTASLIRYQLIMKQVFPAHQELFGKTLRDRVNSETSGTYNSLLMEVMETVDTYF